MKKGTFDKGKIKQKDILEIKTDVMKPLIDKYGHPVLIHAVESKKTFLEILHDGEIKLPKDHSNTKKSPYMETFLGIDNSIFLSLGFEYWVNYNFRFSFIFDWSILKHADYYWRPLSFKCYSDIAMWWYENDREYLNLLGKQNAVCGEVVGRYIEGRETNNPLMFFEFWKIEEVLFNFIMKYKKKNVLLKLVKKRVESLRRKYPYTKVLAKRDWCTNNCPEIIYPKSLDLLGSNEFLGFFIDGDVPADVMKVLKSKYSGKILFNGKKIVVL
jgi:hypothetical protein